MAQRKKKIISEEERKRLLEEVERLQKNLRKSSSKMQSLINKYSLVESN